MKLINFFRNKINKIIFSGIVISTLTVIGGFFGYLSQILLGRYLSLEEYATFTAIFALCAFVNSPLNGIMLIYSRKVTYLNSISGDIISLYKTLIIKILILLIILFFFIVYLDQYISNLLKYETIYIYFIYFFFLINFLTTINSSFFNGLKQSFWFGAIGSFQQFLKLIFFLILIFVSMSLKYFFVSVLFSLIIVFLLSTNILFKIIKNITNHYKKSITNQIFDYKSKYLSVIVASVSFVGLTQLDIFYANYLFAKDQAGYFALAAILGKAILYISHGLSYSLFPFSSEASAMGKNDTNNLFKVIGTSSLISIFISIIFFFFSYEILYFVFNVNNIISSNILKYYGFVIFPYTQIYILENYLISKDKIIFAWISLIFLPLQLSLTLIYATTLESILIIFSGTGYLLLLVGILFMSYILKYEKKLSDKKY